MDLMTLAAKITLDDASYRKGLNNAESLTQQFGNKVSAMTVAVGNIMADVMKKTVSAIGDVVGGAVDGYADYQQLIGGVETLFKSSASRVAKYAEQSYKTTGLSANAYMETVTSFSASLLQGLNGDTEAAADLANTAITDMADNANKMGTDISSIQTAYMGFAKQNYTMLDNLKLGYGGTKDEMVRLINDSGILGKEIKSLDGITFDQLVQAIHVVQTKMGITGTTAKEAAETISGSKASLEASWADFLVAIGGETDQQRLNEASERFKTSFSTYVENNLAPQIKTTIENAPALVTAVSDAITSLPSKAISSLAGSGVDLLTSTVEGATQIAGWITDGLVELFKDINADPSKIADLGNAVGTFIGSALSDIVTNAPTIISGLFTAGVSLAGSLIEGLFSGLFGADEGVYGEIKDANDEMVKSIADATESSTKAKGIVEYMQGLVDKYGEAATGTQAWADAQKALNEVMPGATDYLNAQNGSLETALKNLKGYADELRKLAIEEAKRKALQTKQDAWTTAQAELLSAQAQIEVQRNVGAEARTSLVDYIRQYGGDKGFTGEGLSSKQLSDAAYATLADRFKNGAGDIGYAEDASALKAWVESLSSSDEEIAKLEGSLGSLEEKVRFAETEYLTSAAAVDKLTGSASSASKALQAIKTPSITLSSGAYYNSYYGGAIPRAVGIDYVPYDGFRAELHRGEAIVTASENAARRNGRRDGGFSEEAMEQAVINAFGKLYINMDGNRVADFTTRRMERNINASSAARVRSMGG